MPASDYMSVRVTGEERARADALLVGLQKTYPATTRAGLVREALRLGLVELEKNPRKALMGSATSGSRH